MTMEVEIKSRADDFFRIRRKLSDMGAEYLGKVRQRDIYFNHPSRDFIETDEALRIRYSDERTFITYKGPRMDRKTKSREEIEFEISSGHAAEKILERLGFKRSGEVSKLRENYSIDNMQISLDDVESLGRFVEIEIKGEHNEENIEKLFTIAKKLGLKEFITESYLEMVLKN